VTALQDLLALPDEARVQHRLTKKEIAGQYDDGAPADARYLRRAVAQATIVGVLRPETVGVTAIQDADRRVDFIPLLEVGLAEAARLSDARRTADLLQRSMPRPVVILFVSQTSASLLSVGLTRLNRNDASGETSVVESSILVPVEQIAPGSLALSRLNRADLWALYCDLVRTAAADGRPASAALTAARAIEERRRLADLTTELDTVERTARREKNVQRRIDLNTRATRLRREIAETRAALFAPETSSTETATSIEETSTR
jgi:hypothetical protein